MRIPLVPEYVVAALCLFFGLAGCASPEKAILLPGAGAPPPTKPSLTRGELWDRSVSEVEKLFVIKSNDMENYRAVTEYQIDMEAGKRIRRYASLEMIEDAEGPWVRVFVYKQVAKNKIESIVMTGHWSQRQERFVANPVFEGNRLYVRGEGNLYAIGPQ